MKEMTLTDFFKGNETHRDEYIVLYKKGDFYEAYGKDAERLAYCTGVTLTRPKDGSRAWAGFPWRQLMTGCNGYGRYLSKMLHSFFVVLVDDSGIVTDYYTAKLEDGYEFESNGSVSYRTGDHHLGYIVVPNILWSQYYNGLRVHRCPDGDHVWAFVMCGRNNDGIHYLYAFSALTMTGVCAKSYRAGLQLAEAQHHKHYLALTYILMNNNEYRPVWGGALPDGFPAPMDCLPRNFTIDPDDDKQLIASDDFGTYVYARLD